MKIGIMIYHIVWLLLTMYNCGHAILMHNISAALGWFCAVINLISMLILFYCKKD